MKQIKLTQGKFTLVDDEDYEFLNQWKWHAHKDGNTFYAMRNIKRNGKWTTIRMHQVLAERLGIKGMADHISRNGLDNWKRNLRSVTNKQSNENRGVPKNNTSGHKGVHWRKDCSKWQAKICHNYKYIHLGYFDKIEDAIKARKEGERKYFTHA